MKMEDMIEKLNSGKFTHLEINNQGGVFTIISPPYSDKGEEVQDLLCEGDISPKTFASEEEARKYAESKGLKGRIFLYLNR